MNLTTDSIPHGGKLINCLIPLDKLEQFTATAKKLPKISLTPRQCSDLEMIAIGGFSPLTGFVGKKDYEAILNNMRLANGLPWTIPITLAVDKNTFDKLTINNEIALTKDSGDILAVLRVEEKFTRDNKKEAESVFGTTDSAHPGVAALYAQPETLLAGPISVFALPSNFPGAENGINKTYRLTPEPVRKLKGERQWRTMVGFQTRNPIHRAHEFITKCALEICDGLLIHPIVGETKADDIPANVRMRCYEALLSNYYPKNRVLLAVNPSNMYYAGPKEAILHALVRKNFGCTHFIVGRDHAGVGNYYGPFDAQKIFEKFKYEELGITPLFFDNSFWCKLCGSMATEKTCPHAQDNRLSLSGTKVREILRSGQLPPPEFTRPEVADVLRAS